MIFGPEVPLAHDTHGERRYHVPEDTASILLVIPPMLGIAIVTTVVMAVRIFS